KLNTAKEKFISIISHDLKSPFTSIVGFAELILTDSTLSKEEIIEFVGHIKEASFHTVDLLNGLLDLTKLQTGRIEVEPKIINAHYIANKTVEILSGLAFQKGLSLSTNIDKSFYVTADENLIFQVFNNLVANSIKFTPKGGSIEINAKELPDKQRVEFSVKDTGVGIEQEDLDKLFVLDKKFTTLGTDGERGTGLGLSLVYEIIEKHLGQISVKSEIGKGSEFIFTLPISTPSILILDGNQAERILYTKLLESITKSIEIIQAETEDEGIALIKEKMPMLVIFEHSLPNMFGDEFIGEIKKAGLYYEPSLLVLTNDFDAELENSYKEIGVSSVFSKPFDLKEFKKKLDKLTGKTE
ncbi:MAG: hybrid sensor histidine kinase/response regulator, partial [Melioribacteraceae bacterium]|nr:hybrid sensor histidine kinase/response regulator [Melioribacteraceae bacterium]